MEDRIINQITENYHAPAYIFDIEKIKNRIAYLKEHLPKKIELCYAIKANTFIIEDIQENVERFEVCSPGEYEICKKKNIPEEKIVISGIYKTPEFIRKLIHKRMQ